MSRRVFSLVVLWLLTLFLCSIVCSFAQSVSAPSFVPGRLLVKFQAQVSDSEIHNLVAAAGARRLGELPRIGVQVLSLPANASESAMAHAFRGKPEVLFAEPDYIVPPSDTIPNDPYYSSAWHLPKIAAPAAWDLTTGSSGVIVAILDTGVDSTHPDLAAKITPGWNTYDNNADTSDVYGHGTAVAGTAAASSNNGAGVAAIAWGCKIMPMRISDTQGFGYSSTVSKALTWAADRGARVANISYRFSDDATVTTAAKYFQSRGGVVTISSGNQSTFFASADNPYVLTVGATDSADNLASWSNTGNNLDLVAPGVSIRTTNRGGSYGSWSGTSFSAPATAGVAALVISANPGLSAPQVQDILKQSADDKGIAGWDTTYGWGRINASRAVQMALGTSVDTTPPAVSITSPASGDTVSGVVTIQASASDNIGVASVSLSVDGALLATDTAAPYAFTWDTSKAANGSHTLTATAADTSSKTASASVTVTVFNAGDTTPPSIAITAPTAGTTVGVTVSITVQAVDNVAVQKVETYVDGKLVATSTAAPFTTKWNSKKVKAGSHTLHSKAYDAAGNSAVSSPVTVNK